MRGDSEQGWVPASYLSPEDENKPEETTTGTRTDEEVTSIHGKKKHQEIFQRVCISLLLWMVTKHECCFFLCVCVLGNRTFSGLDEEGGEDYVAIAAYCGEHRKDISFPQGAIVKVLEKNASGWWVVR